MKRSLGDDLPKLTVRVGDRDVPVKSDSDDSDDEYDANWNLVMISKESYRKHQHAIINGKVGFEGGVSKEDGNAARNQQVQPSVIRVTNYVPTTDRAAIRERSIRSLDAVREAICERTGRPSRLVVDTTTGLLLSRDTVDNSLYESADASSSSNFHYQSSVRALERMRDLRLMRKLDDVME